MRIFSLGDGALTVEFGDEISTDLNQRAIGLAEFVRRNSFPGFIESVPAYASTTIFYDVAETRRSLPGSITAFEYVSGHIKSAVDELPSVPPEKGRSIVIPMTVDSLSALDLEHVAEVSGLPADQVIEAFVARTYNVYMLGYLPGFAYMGTVDKRIAAPRKRTPRVRVPKGSIGIAGRQTGIYPLESPGGWQIIGRTSLSLFDPLSADPCFLRPGDKVNFILA